MSTNADDENATHIQEDRLVEISRDTTADCSKEEIWHLAYCEQGARLLGALVRVEKDTTKGLVMA